MDFFSLCVLSLVIIGGGAYVFRLLGGLWELL